VTSGEEGYSFTRNNFFEGWDSMNNKTKYRATLSPVLLSFFLYPFAAAQDNLTENLTTAWKFFNAGNYEKALPYFEKAVKQDPKNADAYFYIGVCNVNLGRNKEAVEAYKQAIRFNPDYAKAHYNLGVAYGKLGRYREAVEA